MLKNTVEWKAKKAAMDRTSQDMKGIWKLPLAAVRSSAPREDVTGASLAGAFETVLGVGSEALVDSVKKCFASLFDYRVFSYMSTSDTIGGDNNTDEDPYKPAFATVVMEMVDSDMAGVAFSVNPINKLVVDY
mmetsp:Transcript_29137/g.44052  ORF Transcript_29137/g.44052 Transcript_29137/m.44052 type:complete len:133 (-) Transcript_29137:2382-2780(-)